MERSGTPALVLLSAAPVMTKERFAELVGVEVGVVRGMLDRGHLPAKKIGRHRLVNVALLQAWCLAGQFDIREEPATYDQDPPGAPKRDERSQDKAESREKAECTRQYMSILSGFPTPY